MIRTVALGVICLAGLGAIAAAAKKSRPPSPSPEVVFPVVVGNKTDRLPIRTQDTLTDTDKVDVVYVPSTGQDQIHQPQPAPPEAAGQRLSISFLAVGTIRAILGPRRQSKELAA